jgi:hypothetical protein
MELKKWIAFEIREFKGKVMHAVHPETYHSE